MLCFIFIKLNHLIACLDIFPLSCFTAAFSGGVYLPCILMFCILLERYGIIILSSVVSLCDKYVPYCCGLKFLVFEQLCFCVYAMKSGWCGNVLMSPSIFLCYAMYNFGLWWLIAPTGFVCVKGLIAGSMVCKELPWCSLYYWVALYLVLTS